ncbi:metallophosphoesterase [Nannocystis pusilla]|uniref:metallophosphoesterase n=1 Tax=Nannocystis pusilla TaxID=889268 RepID=UPI003BF30CD6
MEKLLYSWLHVSDIHQDHGNTETRWDQAFVLAEMVKDLEKIGGKNVPSPQSIFVTGDIAFSGGAKVLPNEAISREYERAGGWLAQLAQAAGLKDDDIFTVPGNHDTVRLPERQRDLRRLVTALRTNQELIDEVFANAEDNELLLSRQKNYQKFAVNYSPWHLRGAEIKTAHWEHTIDSPHMSIDIIGINTALLAENGEDRGKLRVGKSQIQGLMKPRRNSLPQVIIVLSHHPFDWVAEGLELSRWTRANATLHLCGHVHDASSEQSRGGSGQELIKIIAGAAHGEAGEIVGHGYNVAGIYALPDGKIELRIWPRVWSEKNKRFQTDADNTSPDKTYAEHDLTTLVSVGGQQFAGGASLSGAQVLSSDVASADASRHAHVTLTIVSEDKTERVQRIQLSDVPVPLCDSPPTAPAWVGREAELDILNDRNLRVAVISGIGGQGKSVLAARHILQSQAFIWDWRDCREMGDTIQTHILRIIERLSEGGITAKQLTGASVEELLRIFFQILGKNIKCVFVFDNIDHYIDSEISRPVSGMKALMEGAMRYPHHSLFIFTCRPSVAYEESTFYNLPLSGLSVKETQQLFELRGVNVDDSQMRRSIADAQSLTQGHPLWLNVLATQVSKNKASLSELISDIRRGKGSGLPQVMLNAIWKTLNSNQQDVLRCMAEAVRPETEEQLAGFLEGRLNYNRYSKSLRTLIGLNMIVIRSSPGATNTLELHPVVREYVRAKFRIEERRKFIEPITRLFDQLLEKFRPRMSEATFPMMENWTVRAELAINARKFVDAVSALEEVHGRLMGAGYAEEFTRVSGLLFAELNWDSDIDLDLLGNGRYTIDSLMQHYVKACAELGKYNEAEKCILNYEKTIPGKSARYINLCSIRCHYYWMRGDYDVAVFWGRKGVDVRERLEGDTQFRSEWNLALALRDSGQVDEALPIFLAGEELDEVVSESTIDLSKRGEFYGNIGRCLWAKHDVQKALVCYRKSALLLEESKAQESSVNRGWARLWIAEALERQGEVEEAFRFYKDAQYVWSKSLPLRAEQAGLAAERLVEHVRAGQGATSLHMNEVMIEDCCLRWIRSANFSTLW